MYEIPITIEAGRPEVNMKIEEVVIKEPFINKVEIEFPAGCCGEVKLRIYYGIRRYWPLGEGQSFSSDDHVIIFYPHYKLPTTPMTFRIVGWAPATQYDHTIVVRLEVRETMEDVETSLLSKLYFLFRRLI